MLKILAVFGTRPEAIKMAYKRFGLFSPMEAAYLIGMYLAMCSKYTHSAYIVDYLEEEVRKRKYEDWQKVSWKEIYSFTLALCVPSLGERSWLLRDWRVDYGRVISARSTPAWHCRPLRVGLCVRIE